MEVLVALTIISLAAAGALTAVGNFADQQGLLQTRLKAETVAWNRLLEEYRTSRGWQPSNASTAAAAGSEESGGRTWSWRLSSEETLTGFLIRYQVDVHAEENSNRSHPDISMAAFFPRENR